MTEQISAKQFWQRQLAAIEITKLPYHSSATDSDSAGLFEGQLCEQTLAQLAKLTNTTSATAVFAGHLFLLTRLCASDSIVTGLQLTGDDGTAQFPIIADWHCSMSVADWLERTTQWIAQGLENDPQQIDAAKQAIGIDETLYDCCFIINNADVVVSLEDNGPSLIISCGQNGSLSYHFDQTKFNLEQIERYFNYLRRLLNQMARLCESVLDAHWIYDQTEKDFLLNQLNNNAVALDLNRLLPDILAQHAKQRPQAIALRIDDVELSYEALTLRICSMIEALEGAGVKHGDKVAVFCPRGLEWAILTMATMSMGVIYLPIDTSYPAHRVEHMLNQGEVSFVVVTDPSQAAIKDVQCEQAPQILHYEQLVLTVVNEPLLNSDRIKPEDVAYILFTSGSTGFPKGAMVEHQGMLNHLYCKVNDLTMTSDSVVAQNATQCFDVSIWQLISALLVGGTTVIYPDRLLWDLDEFADYTQSNRVDILEVVPSYLDVLLEELEDDGAERMHGLRYLMVTGERVTTGQVKRWFASYPKIEMVNAYGPTEASDDITHYFIDNSFSGARVPIGFPIQNANIYIVDRQMNLAPLGSIGEICVSGVCVGRGYINRPQETEKAFCTNPFNDGQYNRMYKTGDYGRWLPEGSIEFLGRKDEQVKVGGVRIELSEIEHHLSLLEGVNDATVLLHDQKLFCFYTGSDEAQSIRNQLKDNLPVHLIPSEYTQLELMPVNNSGKVDKHALKAMLS